MAQSIGLEPTAVIGPPQCRSFTLFDAMILTAGLALAMSMGIHLVPLLADQAAGLWRDAAAHRGDVWERWPAFWRATHDHLRNTVWYALQLTEAALGGLALAFIVVRLRRPRPPLRALLRQRGAAATLAMMFGVLWGTGLLLAALPGRVDSFTAAPIAVGGCVAVAWTLLAVSRLRAIETGWIDRLGLILGCLAIVIALAVVLVWRI